MKSLKDLHYGVRRKFSSLQLCPLWVVGGTWETIQRRSSSSLFYKSSCGQFLHGQGCPFFDSFQHFLCRPRRHPPSKVPRRMLMERLSWRVTCPNHASFRLLTVARSGSCGPTRKLILLRTQSLVLCSKLEMWKSFLRHLVSTAWILFFQSQQAGSTFHSHWGGWRSLVTCKAWTYPSTYRPTTWFS